MPFMIKQTRNRLEVQDKMKIIKPEMEAIQKKYKDKNDVQSKNEMQQELMKLYQQHHFNPLASFSGCLPLLVQMPILIAFYHAIRRTPEIVAHNFLWFNIGCTNIILTIFSVAIYVLL